MKQLNAPSAAVIMTLYVRHFLVICFVLYAIFILGQSLWWLTVAVLEGCGIRERVNQIMGIEEQ